MDDSGPAQSDVLKSAVRKIMERREGELTQEERAAVKRHEKEKEERLRWKFYESIPQKHWRAMSGRQLKVLNDQAIKYKIPFNGKVVKLPDVVRAIHDFLAANKNFLCRDRENNDLRVHLGGGLETYRQERATITRIKRMELQQMLLPRDEVKQALGRIALILRQAGDSLQRQFGPGAADLLYSAIEEAQVEIERVFGERSSQETNDQEDGNSTV